MDNRKLNEEELDKVSGGVRLNTQNKVCSYCLKAIGQEKCVTYNNKKYHEACYKKMLNDKKGVNI